MPMSYYDHLEIDEHTWSYHIIHTCNMCDHRQSRTPKLSVSIFLQLLLGAIITGINVLNLPKRLVKLPLSTIIYGVVSPLPGFYSPFIFFSVILSKIVINIWQLPWMYLRYDIISKVEK